MQSTLVILIRSLSITLFNNLSLEFTTIVNFTNYFLIVEAPITFLGNWLQWSSYFILHIKIYFPKGKLQSFIFSTVVNIWIKIKLSYFILQINTSVFIHLYVYICVCKYISTRKNFTTIWVKIHAIGNSPMLFELPPYSAIKANRASIHFNLRRVMSIQTIYSRCFILVLDPLTLFLTCELLLHLHNWAWCIVLGPPVISKRQSYELLHWGCDSIAPGVAPVLCLITSPCLVMGVSHTFFQLLFNNLTIAFNIVKLFSTMFKINQQCHDWFQQCLF